MNFTKEDFEAWQDFPVSQAIMEYCKRKRAARRQDWEDGVYTEPTFEAAIQKQSVALGFCSGMKEIENLTFEEIETELSDDSE